MINIEDPIAEFNAVDISYKFMEKLNLKEEELYDLAYANSIRDAVDSAIYGYNNFQVEEQRFDAIYCGKSLVINHMIYRREIG